MEKQLHNFTAGKFAVPVFDSGDRRFFFLPIGEKACQHQSVFLQNLCDCWNLSDADFFTSGFSQQSDDHNFPVTLIPDPHNWSEEEIRRVNQDADLDTYDFLTQWCPKTVLFGLVWADDPLISIAPDLFNLYRSWLSSNGAPSLRCILAVILPRWNDVDTAQVPDTLNALLKMHNKTTGNVLCTRYKDDTSSILPPTWDNNNEIYFFDESPRDSAECLRDIPLILKGTSGGSLYLPAFCQIDLTYENVLIRQILGCITQLEQSASPGITEAAGIMQLNIVNDIRNYVSETEGPESDFRTWMNHGRVFLRDPAQLSSGYVDLYGTWFKDLASAWCSRLLSKSFPTQMFSGWLSSYTPGELDAVIKQLQNYIKPTAATASRRADINTGSCSSWTDYLNLRIQSELISFYRETVDERVQQLVQHMLTLARKHQTTPSGSDWNALRRIFSTAERRCRFRTSFNPVVMTEEQMVRCAQLLQKISQAEHPDYHDLFVFVSELIHESLGNLTPWLISNTQITPCCRHMFPMDVRSEYIDSGAIPAGNRCGQLLYLLRLDQSVPMKDISLQQETPPARIQAKNLQFYMNLGSNP